MIRARVDVRDLMTLRAAALQVQARRGAQFAPPEVIRTPIEWAAKPVQSERMRVGDGRVPDVELTDRWCSDLLTKQTESVSYPPLPNPAP